MRKVLNVFLTVVAAGIACEAQVAPAAQPVINSYISFSLMEKDLLPENVAYDPVDKAFYVGSTRKGKIVRFKDGAASDFASREDHGLWQVIGMKVDPARRVLWVCSSMGENLEGYSKSDTNPAGIFKFDLRTGELIKKYVLETPGEVHFFNDLVIGPSGDVFATHMFKEAAIYTIAAERDELEVFLKPDRFAAPNGIAISDDGGRLFIAHQFGVKTLNVKTKEFLNLQYPENVTMKGIDGLYFFDRSLIAIHSEPGQVRRYRLDESLGNVISGETLESGHPLLRLPTTGVIIDGSLHYVANSQFDAFTGSGELLPYDRLVQPVILRVGTGGSGQVKERSAETTRSDRGQ
ncbi:MAG: hypothetical protein IPM63_04415 [Acidobacteriota bacterium]|nr:MAG: hypothetical protein IPM63_04415 [Acidobacteriota bacterium]